MTGRATKVQFEGNVLDNGIVRVAGRNHSVTNNLVARSALSEFVLAEWGKCASFILLHFRPFNEIE